MSNQIGNRSALSSFWQLCVAVAALAAAIFFGVSSYHRATRGKIELPELFFHGSRMTISIFNEQPQYAWIGDCHGYQQLSTKAEAPTKG
jgi:hypothetical protein